MMAQDGSFAFISCPLRVVHRHGSFVNAAGLSEESHLTVELLDQRFNPVPGYSGDDSIKITKSGLREPVDLANKQNWRNLASRSG